MVKGLVNLFIALTGLILNAQPLADQQKQMKTEPGIRFTPFVRNSKGGYCYEKNR